MLRVLLTFFVLCVSSGFAATGDWAQLSQKTDVAELPTAPASLSSAYIAKLGTAVVLIAPNAANSSDEAKVYTLASGGAWTELAPLSGIPKRAGFTASGDTVVLVGGLLGNQPSAAVVGLTLKDGAITRADLASLPTATVEPAVSAISGTLYVAGGSRDGSPAQAISQFLTLSPIDASGAWQEKSPAPGPARMGGHLVKSVETIAYLGGVEPSGEHSKSIPYFHSRYGWSDATPASFPPGQVVDAAKIGDSHALALINDPASGVHAYLYHMVGQTWVTLGSTLAELPSDTRVTLDANGLSLFSAEKSFGVTFANPETNYGWWDHVSVALYFVVMLIIGFYFANQSKNTEDYFRGGHKIPWWATGMSLFATGASAMSLMAMPGKSYSSNWTFFAISIYSVLALPISMYFFAPIIRKLNFGTAFEYLECRFGLSVRLIGSAIFAVYQILGRMGGVLLLPSFALEAIAGIPMHISVPVMGLVTIAYTFLGGLSAVIWTDTLQGIVMVSAVGGCLLLVLFRIDMPFSEIWTTLQAQDKLHTFDWGFSLTNENVFTVFLGIVFVTLLGIGDQNFVQRVQCGNSLQSTRKAVATQMAVAVPINILLFTLGTALFLFYKQAPQELNPTMRNDGIYPFFAAQQLPPGVSGLVIAALLAATMSTISSSICSVSNLAVDDFYKRFSKKATDAKAIQVGRLVTVAVGLFGIGSAFYLNSFETPSIWDLALRVVSIVTATTVGIYFLGLFTEKANETGALIGIAFGMATTFWISKSGLLIFWLYPVAGSLVTIVVGYAVSLATGGNTKNIDGLTLATLKNRTGGLDD